ncbi:MAG: hypothetical protein ABIU95_04345 [Burkholderiales bacterium]
MQNNLLLVGSIPLDSTEAVFGKFGGGLGRYLGALPDGEVGLRRHWISRIHFQVFALHPDIEIVRRPQLENGVERLNARNTGDSWLFRIRDGVERIRFGEPGWRIGYARDAINSYFVFKTLRERGVIPAHLRFQVSIASVNSAAPPRILVNPERIHVLREAYEHAIADEVNTIVAHIPAKDLAIQWDCSTEIQDVYGAAPPFPLEGAIERNAAPFARLGPLVPDEAQIGYHLCYGTLGGWPRFVPKDLSATVDLANAIIEGSGRRVDWMHIPLLNSTDDAFFAPLAKLRPGSTRIFLGAIHNMERYGTRVAAARKYLPEFGVAAFCGFGRMPPADMPRVLADHLKAMEAVVR